MTQYRKWAMFALALGATLGLAACDEDPTNIVLDPPSLTVTETDAGLQLEWTAVAGADSYTVRRQVGNATFEVLAAEHTDTSYLDEGVARGNTYTYVVRAVAGSEFQSSDPAVHNLGEMATTVSGTISADRTFYADTVYTLQGTVTVPDGVTLTVEAGTLVLGDVNVQPTALIVSQGGRVHAEGTADAPIVFTSSRPEGSRARGDWGGVVINGRSICNFPNADDCVAEGFAATYGGDVNDDDSGTLAYVRIEYAGYEVSLGNELNALTLNGVGSGTTLHHVQTHYGLDDGFEFFGGTVDLKYALATGISDDSFDYSTGWQGRGQFWIALADPDDADNGFEVDNNESDFDATPRTNPLIYNVTLVGKAAGTGTAGEVTDGLKLRRGTAGIIRNVIVMGYGSAGLEIDDVETETQCTDGSLVVSNAIFFDNAEFTDSDSDTYEATCLAQAGWVSILQQDPALGDPYNWSAPDFQPAGTSPAADPGNAATPPADAFWTATDYIGAVDPADANPWYQGWTTFARN